MPGVQRIAATVTTEPDAQRLGSFSAPFSCLRRLHAAIENRDERRAAELLQSCISESIDVRCMHRGRTALHVACSAGLGLIAERLIAAGADVNATDDSDAAPLLYACLAGHTAVVNVLLERGADASLAGRDNQGVNLLELAIRGYPDELASMLISSSCSLDSVNRKGLPLLHVCAELNKSTLARLLLSRGCAIDKGDINRQTAVSIAAAKGSAQSLHLLIEAGADLNLLDWQRNSALSYAVQGGFLSCSKLLIDAGADQTLCNSKRITPLMYAVKALDLPTMELLLTRTGQKCPVIDMEDWEGSTPLLAAVRAAIVTLVHRKKSAELTSASKSAVQLLIDAGCSVNKADATSGQTPLILSCHGDCTDVVKMLLSAGADVHGADDVGNTALHVAVERGNTETVELLLLRLNAEGCGINARNAAAQTPIFKAADKSVPIQITEMLIASGADLNAQDSRKHSPLHAAIERGHSQMAAILINEGCGYNVLDEAGITPLCLACRKGDWLVMARLLAEPECDINLGRELPLHVAIRKGDQRLAAFLIDRKANINMLNDDGQSPLLLAVEAYDRETIDLLLSLGATAVVGPLPGSPLPGASTAVGKQQSSTRRRCCSSHEDPHPHVVLQPLFECLRFENVQLFKLLLDHHYRTPYALLRTLHDMITINHVDGRSLVSESVRSELLAELRAALDSVRSLRQLCRGAVREHLGERPAAKVPALALPASLQSYLLFREG